MEYICIRDCYFGDRYYRKDDVFECDNPDEKVKKSLNAHFRKMEVSDIEEVGKKETNKKKMSRKSKEIKKKADVVEKLPFE